MAARQKLKITRANEMAKLVFNYSFAQKEYKIEKEITMIGRAPENDIVIPDYSLFKKLSMLEQRLYLNNLKNVSRIHARITLKDNQYYIEDIGTKGLGSNYGTYINDVRIEVKKPYPLTDKDNIKFGPIETIFIGE